MAELDEIQTRSQHVNTAHLQAYAMGLLNVLSVLATLDDEGREQVHERLRTL